MTKDAVVFPIQITFDRVGESGAVREVKRTLFGTMNSYPSKKVITFNKNTEDFYFEVKYDELNHLSEKEIECLGSKVLSRVQLNKVSEILKNNLAENVASKGIKAHFTLDDSGIFDLVNVELLLEKTVAPENEDQNTFQKISNTISKLFSGPEEDTETNPKDPEPQAEENKTSINATQDNLNSSSNQTDAGQIDANKTESVKVVTVKEPIPSNVSILYVTPIDKDQYADSEDKVRIALWRHLFRYILIFSFFYSD